MSMFRIPARGDSRGFMPSHNPYDGTTPSGRSAMFSGTRGGDLGISRDTMYEVFGVPEGSEDSKARSNQRWNNAYTAIEDIYRDNVITKLATNLDQAFAVVAYSPILSIFAPYIFTYAMTTTFKIEMMSIIPAEETIDGVNERTNTYSSYEYSTTTRKYGINIAMPLNVKNTPKGMAERINFNIFGASLSLAYSFIIAAVSYLSFGGIINNFIVNRAYNYENSHNPATAIDADMVEATAKQFVGVVNEGLNSFLAEIEPLLTKLQPAADSGRTRKYLIASESLVNKVVVNNTDVQRINELEVYQLYSGAQRSSGDLVSSIKQTYTAKLNQAAYSLRSGKLVVLVLPSLPLDTTFTIDDLLKCLVTTNQFYILKQADRMLDGVDGKYNMTGIYTSEDDNIAWILASEMVTNSRTYDTRTNTFNDLYIEAINQANDYVPQYPPLARDVRGLGMLRKVLTSHKSLIPDSVSQQSEMPFTYFDSSAGSTGTRGRVKLATDFCSISESILPNPAVIKGADDLIKYFPKEITALANLEKRIVDLSKAQITPEYIALVNEALKPQLESATATMIPTDWNGPIEFAKSNFDITEFDLGSFVNELASLDVGSLGLKKPAKLFNFAGFGAMVGQFGSIENVDADDFNTDEWSSISKKVAKLHSKVEDSLASSTILSQSNVFRRLSALAPQRTSPTDLFIMNTLATKTLPMFFGIGSSSSSSSSSSSRSSPTVPTKASLRLLDYLSELLLNGTRLLKAAPAKAGVGAAPTAVKMQTNTRDFYELVLFMKEKLFGGKTAGPDAKKNLDTLFTTLGGAITTDKLLQIITFMMLLPSSSKMSLGDIVSGIDTNTLSVEQTPNARFVSRLIILLALMRIVLDDDGIDLPGVALSIDSTSDFRPLIGMVESNSNIQAAATATDIPEFKDMYDTLINVLKSLEVVYNDAVGGTRGTGSSSSSTGSSSSSTKFVRTPIMYTVDTLIKYYTGIKQKMSASKSQAKLSDVRILPGDYKTGHATSISAISRNNSGETFIDIDAILTYLNGINTKVVENERPTDEINISPDSTQSPFDVARDTITLDGGNDFNLFHGNYRVDSSMTRKEDGVYQDKRVTSVVRERMSDLATTLKSAPTNKKLAVNIYLNFPTDLTTVCTILDRGIWGPCDFGCWRRMTNECENIILVIDGFASAIINPSSVVRNTNAINNEFNLKATITFGFAPQTMMGSFTPRGVSVVKNIAGLNAKFATSVDQAQVIHTLNSTMNREQIPCLVSFLINPTESIGDIFSLNGREKSTRALKIGRLGDGTFVRKHPGIFSHFYLKIYSRLLDCVEALEAIREKGILTFWNKRHVTMEDPSFYLAEMNSSDFGCDIFSSGPLFYYSNGVVASRRGRGEFSSVECQSKGARETWRGAELAFNKRDPRMLGVAAN